MVQTLRTSDITTKEIWDIVNKRLARETGQPLEPYDPVPAAKDELGATKSKEEYQKELEEALRESERRLREENSRDDDDEMENYLLPHTSLRAASNDNTNRSFEATNTSIISSDTVNSSGINETDNPADSLLRSVTSTVGSGSEATLNMTPTPANTSLPDHTETPKPKRYLGEEIYLEKYHTPCSLTVSALVKDLPTLPIDSTCSNMVTVNDVIESKAAIVLQSPSQLSILVGWSGKHDSYHPDIKEDLRTMDIKSADEALADAPAEDARILCDSASAIKLQLSHPSISDLTSLEIRISDPLENFNDLLSHKDVYFRRHGELKIILAALTQKLASFEKLENVKLVLAGWGRGQSFRKGGHGAECVMPFFEVLLEQGFRIGVELLIWHSTSVSKDESQGWIVRDTRRSLHEMEAQDLKDELLLKCKELGGSTTAIRMENLGTATWIEYYV